MEAYERMSVQYLRGMAASRGQPVYGTKSTLIERLVADDSSPKRRKRNTLRDYLLTPQEVNDFITSVGKSYGVKAEEIQDEDQHFDRSLSIQVYGQAAKELGCEQLSIPYHANEHMHHIYLRTVMKIRLSMLQFSLYDTTHQYLNPRQSIASLDIESGDTVELVVADLEDQFASHYNIKKKVDRLYEHPEGYWSCTIN